MKKKYRWKPLKFVFNLMIIALVVYACKFVYTSIDNMMYPLRYEYYISSNAYANKLDKFLVAAVIKTESNFISDAHSGKARGLMQLTDDTASWVADKIGIEFKHDDLDVPEVNIKMGCWYLKYLIDKYENIDTALAAYNGGMGNVSKWLNNKQYSDDGKTLKYIPFKETREYVKKVNKYKSVYEEKYRDNLK